MNSLGLMSLLLAALPMSDAASKHAMEAVMPRIYIPRGHNRSSDHLKGCAEHQPIPPKTARQLKKEEKYLRRGLTNKLGKSSKKSESKTESPAQADMEANHSGAD